MKNYPEMYSYMKNYNKSTVAEGVASLKKGYDLMLSNTNVMVQVHTF